MALRPAWISVNVTTFEIQIEDSECGHRIWYLTGSKAALYFYFTPIFIQCMFKNKGGLLNSILKSTPTNLCSLQSRKVKGFVIKKKTEKTVCGIKFIPVLGAFICHYIKCIQ